MKLSISIAAALAALAFVPLASATAVDTDLNTQSSCIIYPGSYYVGGFWVQTGDRTIPGKSYTIFFLTVTTQPVTVYGAGVYVPGTWVNTPGVCYGNAADLINEIATLA